MCLGYLMLLLTGLYTPSSMPRDETRSHQLALDVSERLLTKVSQDTNLNHHEQYLLGRMYGNGVGVLKDASLAFEWYLKSAEQGYAAGQNNVGYCYKNGVGVAKDESLAIEWFRKSAEQRAKGRHNCCKGSSAVTRERERLRRNNVFGCQTNNKSELSSSHI